MTTEQNTDGPDVARLNENIAKMEALSQRLMAALSQKRTIDPNLQGPDRDIFAKAATAYMADMMQNPAKIIEHQVGYWGKMLKHYVEANQTLVQGRFAAPPDPTSKDRRFGNALWDTHPYFNFIKRNYLMTAEAIEAAVAGLENLAPKEKQQVEYFTRQIVDMLAPTNFLATNPDALERAVETEGQSLVDGLENLVRDIEHHKGDLLVTLADRDAFDVGHNIATTPGKVVFRNRMCELIQYTPTTETVHAVPLIIFPPWINKFYILDLKEKNSLIKWIVDQGYTLFVVSWKNPDKTYADVGIDDYVREGFLEAIGQACEISGQSQVNAIGYCIAGTTLSMTLAWMARNNDKRVKSATLFTTMTDFSDQGELGVFLDDPFVDGIEREVTENGVLDSFFMSRTFSFLRSNDLIYTPAVRSYMMGEAPPAFDLLYWNGDGTNLPAKMAVEYLRGLCQQDLFAQQGFPLLGDVVTLKDVKHPVCAIACETDHIAAWRSSYNGVRYFGSRSKTFILSQSGHIAGIVNPPGKVKYGHYTNPDMKADPDSWQAAAQFHPGSWWPTWEAWLKKKSGPQVPARMPEGSVDLGAAPGTYVRAIPAA
ncbi:MAG: PHA/PHB synthase family protein [Qingshengfaniella sp.]